jgi:hypothetical protein
MSLNDSAYWCIKYVILNANKSLIVNTSICVHLQRSQEKSQLSFIITEMNNFDGSSRNNKALQTFHRVDRFSRKLQRRLTQHTLAELKAIRQYSEDALHFVLYTAELVGSTSKCSTWENRWSGWTPLDFNIFWKKNLICHAVMFVFTTQYKDCIEDMYLSSHHSTSP